MAQRPRRPSDALPRITFAEYEGRVRRERQRKAAARRLRNRRVAAVLVVLLTCFGIATLAGYLTGGSPSRAGGLRTTAVLAEGSAHQQNPAKGAHPGAEPQSSTTSVRHRRLATSLGGKPAVGGSGSGRQRTTSALKPGAEASFASFQRTQPGDIGIAVQPVGGGQETTLGDDAPAHGWSTTKPLVLATLMKSTAGDGGLTAAQKADATTAITLSDNQSIIDLFDDLAERRGGALEAAQDMDSLLRDSGDARTVVATSTDIPAGASTTFGQTLWAPSQAAKFYAALAGGCLLGSTDTSYILGLMEHIEPSESWGLGDAGFRSVAFKGGWGPEDGNFDLYLVRQSGIIAPGSPEAVAVSIVAHPPASSQSFTTGTEMITAAARWLAGQLAYAAFGSGCGLARVG